MSRPVIVRDVVSFTSTQVTTLTTIVTLTTVITGIVAVIGTIAGLRIVMVGGRVLLRWTRP